MLIEDDIIVVYLLLYSCSKLLQTLRHMVSQEAERQTAANESMDEDIKQLRDSLQETQLRLREAQAKAIPSTDREAEGRVEELTEKVSSLDAELSRLREELRVRSESLDRYVNLEQEFTRFKQEAETEACEAFAKIAALEALAVQAKEEVERAQITATASSPDESLLHLQEELAKMTERNISLEFDLRSSEETAKVTEEQLALSRQFIRSLQDQMSKKTEDSDEVSSEFKDDVADLFLMKSHEGEVKSLDLALQESRRQLALGAEELSQGKQRIDSLTQDLNVTRTDLAAATTKISRLQRDIMESSQRPAVPEFLSSSESSSGPQQRKRSIQLRVSFTDDEQGHELFETTRDDLRLGNQPVLMNLRPSLDQDSMEDIIDAVFMPVRPDSVIEKTPEVDIDTRPRQFSEQEKFIMKHDGFLPDVNKHPIDDNDDSKPYLLDTPIPHINMPAFMQTTQRAEAHDQFQDKSLEVRKLREEIQQGHFVHFGRISRTDFEKIIELQMGNAEVELKNIF